MSARYLFVVCLAVLLSSAAPLAADDTPGSSNRVVSARELQTGAQIIGLLGLPLGKLASTKARIIPSDSKEADQYIEILEIGDRRLSEPVRLTFGVWEWGNLSGKTLPLDRVLSLRVYETGGMAGVPPDAMKETTYVASVGWGFRTSVVIVSEER